MSWKNVKNDGTLLATHRQPETFDGTDSVHTRRIPMVILTHSARIKGKQSVAADIVFFETESAKNFGLIAYRNSAINYYGEDINFQGSSEIPIVKSIYSCVRYADLK